MLSIRAPRRNNVTLYIIDRSNLHREPHNSGLELNLHGAAKLHQLAKSARCSGTRDHLTLRCCDVLFISFENVPEIGPFRFSQFDVDFIRTSFLSIEIR